MAFQPRDLPGSVDFSDVFHDNKAVSTPSGRDDTDLELICWDKIRFRMPIYGLALRELFNLCLIWYSCGSFWISVVVAASFSSVHDDLAVFFAVASLA